MKLTPIHQLPERIQILFQKLSDFSNTLEQPLYVIGGFVRNFYLNRDINPSPDIDFVTVGSGIKLAQFAAKELGIENISVFKRFGTAHFNYNGIDLEFVGARKESYHHDSRKPVVEDGTLTDDQHRRDFSINTLSWSLNKTDFGTLYDPFNGLHDLENQVIRTPLNPEKTFSDDPLRMLRAIRFATQLSFTIDSDTLSAISAMADRLSIISKERIIDEVNKIVASPIPSKGFELLFSTGLLHHFFPEMANLHGVEEIDGIRHKDNFWHTLEVLDNVAASSNNLWLRWAAIMHDIAKPPTKRFDLKAGWTFHGHEALGAKWTSKIFRRLGLPLDDRMRYVKKLVRLHLRPIALVDNIVTDSALRRLLFEAGNDIDDLMLLCRADITSKNLQKKSRYLSNFDSVEVKLREVEEKDRLRNWQPPVDGKEIMETFDLKPGPIIGKIKSDIEEAILNGDIPNEHDAAFNYMLGLGEHYNLKPKT